MTLTALGYAFLGGLLPSLIWLYFLLKEDARHPEPKRLIAFAFVMGMAAVPLALPLEQLAKDTLVGSLTTLVAWALIEEVLKYIMAAAFILWRCAVDETPDYIIYMLTVALGFASAENMLFLVAPLSQGQFAMSIFTGDLRFLGYGTYPRDRVAYCLQHAYYSTRVVVCSHSILPRLDECGCVLRRI